MLKNLFQNTWKTRTCKIQTISELYTDYNKSKYSNNLKENFKSAKKFYETPYNKETTFKTTTTDFCS